MNKPDLNNHRQVKEYWTPSHEVAYSVTDKNFKAKVIELRKQYPNDQEFGSAVAKLLKQ